MVFQCMAAAIYALTNTTAGSLAKFMRLLKLIRTFN